MIERSGMTYTETTIEAERVALLEGEKRGDVLAWLTAPGIGHVEREWDDD